MAEDQRNAKRKESGRGTSPTLAEAGTEDAGGESEDSFGRERTGKVAAVSVDDYTELPTVPREHYVFGGEIARGGMGRIFRARDRRLWATGPVGSTQWRIAAHVRRHPGTLGRSGILASAGTF